MIYKYQYKDEAESPELSVYTEIVYHGTHPMLVPEILAEGLKPSLGAGCDGLHSHYGVIIPGVYTSPSWHCASNYPLTGKGTLVSDDGTYPLRAAFRLVADKTKRLWKRKSKNNVQSLYCPDDLYISHIVI